MAEEPADTVREIEAARARLETDFRELGERLPSPAEVGRRVARIGAGVAGGGVALVVTLRTLRAVRRRREASRRPAAVRVVEQVLPGDAAARLEGLLERAAAWRTWMGVAAAVWTVLRLAELRELRRLNRATALR